MNYTVLLKDVFLAATSVSKTRVTIRTGLNNLILDRSASVIASFRGATPIDTGQMVQGWRQHKVGFMQIEIYNEINRKGFSYPSAQITGTGFKGRATAGFTGTFNRSWIGMKPNSKLLSVWENQTSKPFNVGKLF